MELNFTVTNQKIKYVSNLYIVEKSRNYLTAKFSFSGNEWKNVVKTAIFKKDYTVINVVLDESGRCDVPWEVITKGTLKVSVFGGDLVTVDTADVKILKSGYEEGNAPSEPTPDVYAQILTELQDIRSEYVTEEMLGQAVEDWLAENVVEALSPEDVQKIVYGWLEEHKAELKGEKGEPGKDGTNGVTFTPKIVDGVLFWENNEELDNPTSFDFNKELGINELKEDVETLKTATDITTTSLTTQPNSYAGREMVLEIGGVTEQDSTAGKNLAKSTFIGATNLDIYNSPLFVDADFKPNTQYTFSFKGTVGNRYYVNENMFVEDITFTVADGITTFTATTKGEFSSQLMSGGYIILKNHKNQTSQNKFEEFMLVEGSTALPYEPYTGGQPAPNPSYPMEIKKSVVSGVKTHGKNFFKPTLQNTESNGLTCTDNGDGTYKLNGTSNAGGFARFDFGTIHIKGTYKFVGCPNDGSFTTFGLNLLENNDFGGARYATYNKEGIVITENKLFGICIIVEGNTTCNNLVFKPMITTDLEATYDDFEPYQGTEITFSQPIELYGINGMQDVITPNGINRRFSHIKNNGFKAIDGYDVGASKLMALSIPDNVPNSWSYNNMYSVCDKLSAKNVLAVDENGFYVVDFVIYARIKGCSSADEFNAQMADAEFVYPLEIPTTETLPIADQIGLNSLLTYDGITYVEFIYDELEPTFKGKYGTSEVGGMTLESLLIARNNELKQELANERLSALEASVVNNI